MATLLLAPVAALATPPPELDPDTEVARRHFQSGAALYETRQYEKALREFQAAQLVSYRPELDYNIARCYDRMERYEEAVTAYERYVMSAPNSPDVVESRGRIQLLRERIGAMAELRRGASETGEQAATTPAAPPKTVGATGEAATAGDARVAWYRRAWLPAVTGGLALATLATGAGLYGQARGEYSKLETECAPGCDPSRSASVVRRGNSGIGVMIAGGALAAATAGIAAWQWRAGHAARVQALAMPGLVMAGVGGDF